MEHRTAIVTGGSRGPRPRPRPRARRRRVARRHRRPRRRPPCRRRRRRPPGVVADPRRRHRRRPPRRPRAPPPAAADRPVVNNAGGLGPSPLPALADYPLDALAEPVRRQRRRPARPRPGRAARTSRARAVVVDITSDASVEAYEGWGGYGATKAALDHVGRVLAAERPDLRVLTIDPGDMRTQMHQDAFPGEDISDRPPPEDSVPGHPRPHRGRRAERPLPRRRGAAA